MINNAMITILRVVMDAINAKYNRFSTVLILSINHNVF